MACTDGLNHFLEIPGVNEIVEDDQIATFWWALFYFFLYLPLMRGTFAMSKAIIQVFMNTLEKPGPDYSLFMRN